MTKINKIPFFVLAGALFVPVLLNAQNKENYSSAMAMKEATPEAIAETQAINQVDPNPSRLAGTYYNGITATSGKALQSQLHSLINPHTNVGYDGLFEVYKDSDTRCDGTIWDMYGDFGFTDAEKNKNYSNPGDGWNREHSVPKSWWGGGKNEMYADAFHLVPTDGMINNWRSNYCFGEVGSIKKEYKFNNYVSGVSKLGSSNFSGYSGTVFEPADCYKGDFARNYFYFATCYPGKITSGEGTAMFNNDAENGYLTNYAKQLLLKWSDSDPVSYKEVERNEGVYKHQKNRNPFIDHPEYIHAIWGGEPVPVVEPTAITITPSSYSLSKGQTFIPTVTFTPSNTTNKGLTWTTSNASVATVNSSTGLITAVKEGNATITATSVVKNDVKATLSLTVEGSGEILVTSITITPNPITVTEGQTQQISIAILPENATNKNVEVIMGDNRIAEYHQNNNTVEGISAGNTTITVKALDGSQVSKQSFVNVLENPAPSKMLSYITATNPTREYNVGETITQNDIVVTAFYEGGDSKTVTNWTSGQISKKDDTHGEAIISYTEGGVTKTTTVSVTLKNDPVPSKHLVSISSTEPTKSYKVGEAIGRNDIIVKAFYSDGSSSNVDNWVSDTINQSGNSVPVKISYSENGIIVSTIVFVNVEKSGGCGSSIIAASSILCFASILGTTALLIKKKKEK